ncbi:helix-turn-helix domain-containing protein [Gleimia sp. 6138-11-ORH1]|uniref:helix-turn-helix domain-containing protein n=1 Tax=Gleimia sp. 6138-11-ORH1 TaxID=2973937 RepID=UPI0021693A82|nr:helix-turn-helix domain-containing protein [Gleimia sp. 6138-11-ORH1]MCS4484063.1 helix-turn-helix domain-containing protein [Gleimia sp. 6138-11-ORH1]
MEPRFYTLTDISEILNISMSAARALVSSGELPAIQIGGKQAWRVEISEFEAYIERQYEATKARIEAGQL